MNICSFKGFSFQTFLKKSVQIVEYLEMSITDNVLQFLSSDKM